MSNETMKPVTKFSKLFTEFTEYPILLKDQKLI